MNTPKVNIVMATYNGADHIRKQLDSLFDQTYKNFTIVIRDDGSSDETVSIIKEYQKIHGEESIVLLDSPEGNLRPPQSFYAILLRAPQAKYYAFCDQDDVWEKEKIEWAVKKLEEYDNDIPLCYFSSHDYLTGDGDYIRRMPLITKPLKISTLLYQTPGSGFTMVFNHALLKRMVIDKIPGTEMHDRYMMRGAICFGRLIYDSRIAAHHIRYEDSVTKEDAGNKSLLVHFIKDEIFSDTAKIQKKDLKYFYETFKDELDPDNKAVIRLFSKEGKSIRLYFKKLFYPKRLRIRFVGEVAIRLLILIGKI